MHYLHRDLRPEPGRDRPSATRERKLLAPTPHRPTIREGRLGSRHCRRSALLCVTKSLLRLLQPARNHLCARARFKFFCRSARRERRGCAIFWGARRDGCRATGRGGAVRSDARGSTAARALFRTALMPSWRRSCLCARGAAARAVFLRGAAMLGVWGMIRRGFSARGARMCTHWPVAATLPTAWTAA